MSSGHYWAPPITAGEMNEEQQIPTRPVPTRLSSLGSKSQFRWADTKRPTSLCSQDQGLEVCRETQQVSGIQDLFAFSALEVGRQERVSLLVGSAGPAGNQHNPRSLWKPPEEAEGPLALLGNEGCPQRPAHGSPHSRTACLQGAQRDDMGS